MSADQKQRQQLRNEQLRQMRGDYKKLPANKNSKYEINEFESHLVHVELEIKQFNSLTGERESKPYIQKFHPNEFDALIKTNGFVGYSVELVHDPRSEKKAENTSGSNNGEKTIDKMNVEELKAKFIELYGEEPIQGIKKAELITAIQEKIDFLNQENQ